MSPSKHVVADSDFQTVVLNCWFELWNQICPFPTIWGRTHACSKRPGSTNLIKLSSRYLPRLPFLNYILETQKISEANFLSSSKISFPARLPDAHQGHTQFPCQRSSGCYSGHLRGQHGRAPGIHKASGQEGSRLVCLQIRDELKLLSCHFCESAPAVPSFSWIKLYKLSSLVSEGNMLTFAWSISLVSTTWFKKVVALIMP